ncbi:arylesterase [Luteolibacter pohnpeiensis]|uniref:Arylesterase n=2 Tax=Luteolibacter pohnpeiensis TaxID=454153 RepID=A0A934S5Z4_9BACT|nr:arylesterase [Luteolibacter pohnpeiensis]
MRLMTLARFFMLFLILGMNGKLLAQENPKANSTDAKPAPGRIVILGDSITAGYGLDPDEAYPSILQEKIKAAGLNYVVVNAGVSGDTTAGGLRRVAWALGSGADVLVIALGGNDGLRGTPPAETEKNLDDIIKKAKAKQPDIKIIIAGMQMPANFGQDYVTKFRDVFPKVAKDNNAGLVPFLLEHVGGIPSLNQADRIHPTKEGQKLVAENVWPTLEKVLKSGN